MGFVPSPAARPAATVSSRWLLACCLIGCGVGAGCRSNAYRDVYAEKMAAEIRALEDQLYAADYENQVLHQKLQRARAATAIGADVDAADAVPDVDALPEPDRSGGLLEPPGAPSRTLPRATDDLDSFDLDLPEIDPGQPRTAPIPPDDLPATDDPQDVQDRRIEVPGADLGMPRTGRDQRQLVPPSSDELTLPPIDPGEIMPPPDPGAPPEPPPGQIPLPEGLLPVEPVLPTGLAINPIYSGGHNFDADPMIDGVYLVIQFVDDSGTALDLGDMDIDAELIVVMLDPESQQPDPQLGRWEFSADEVAKLRRDSPIDGLHVPLRWDERKPDGQQVAVFVRLVNGTAKLEGERVLPLGGATAVADWTPRAAERLEQAADSF